MKAIADIVGRPGTKRGMEHPSCGAPTLLSRLQALVMAVIYLIAVILAPWDRPGFAPRHRPTRWLNRDLEDQVTGKGRLLTGIALGHPFHPAMPRPGPEHREG